MGCKRLKMLSGCGAQSDVKQKRDEALPLGGSMKPEAQHRLWRERVVHMIYINNILK